MIMRIFQVTTHPGKAAAFARFFHDTAIPLMRSTDGIVQVLPGAARPDSPREFSFVMVWRDLDALRAFVGEDHTSAHIAPDEADLVAERRIAHYDLADGQARPSTRPVSGRPALRRAIPRRSGGSVPRSGRGADGSRRSSRAGGTVPAHRRGAFASGGLADPPDLAHPRRQSATGGTPMSRTVYVNGAYLPEEQATVSVFDRGFLFADGVYEVTSVLGGKLIDFDGHAARLARSLGELGMAAPLGRDDLLAIHRELVARNGIEDGLVYLQITRGAADRDFAYPAPDTPATVVLFTQSKPGMADAPAAKAGIRVISIPDQRWGRRDIKTVQLLYPSMGKMMAKAAGADDAWMVEDGHVTEGTSNNAYIVTGGTIVTRHLGTEILHGITRAAVLRFAREAQMAVEERPFTLDEALAADEAFVTSASAFVMPVVGIDGVTLGDGTPGPVARRLREIYLEESRRSAI